MEEKIGIVLSGGGVRGMAHIGLLKALEENGIEPEYISGASAGALVGVFYAAGYSFEEMLDFFRTTPLFKFSHYSVQKPGIFDSDKFYDTFKEYFPEDSFEALPKRLFISTTNLMEARAQVFSSGQLIKPLLASAALPPVFTPVEIDGQWFSDGGIMNNFPVKPLEGLCDKIIGSLVTHPMEVNKEALNSTKKLLQRVFILQSYSPSAYKFDHFDYVFSPEEISGISTLDTNDIDPAFELGYNKAMEEMDDILEALGKGKKRNLKIA